MSTMTRVDVDKGGTYLQVAHLPFFLCDEQAHRSGEE